MSDEPEDKRFWIYVEDALIILSIGVLWLWITRPSGELTNWAMFITLVVMIVIFFRRIRRIRRRSGD